MAEWKDLSIEIDEHPTQNAVDFAKNINAFYGMLSGVVRINIVISAILILFLSISIGYQFRDRTNQSPDANGDSAGAPSP